MEFKKLPVSKLTINTGQIEGVPANPRQWTQADLDRLAASIEETPELLDARGAIVVPHKGKYVVLGGNMRLTAAKKLGLAEMPCAVLPADTPAEKMKEIVVKDNGQFGAWDFDALANEWDDLPLTDWGVPAWKEKTSPDDFGEEFSLPDGEKSNFCTMSFQVSTEQRDEIEAALELIKKSEDYQTMTTYGNENQNGNALALIIEQYGKMQGDTN